MKRAMIWILCIALLLCAFPAQRVARAETTTVSQTAPLKVRQYGEEQELVVDQNGFAGQILYPAGDVEGIDTVILTWASLTMSEYEKQVEALEAAEKDVKATINVDYESYESGGGRYVGVEEYGTYRMKGGDKPSCLLYTMNYDLTAGKPLALFEIINVAHMDAVIALVQKKLAEAEITGVGKDGLLTKDDMHELVLRDDGIEWLFLTDTGVVGAIVSYDELAGYLALTEAAPTPAATPVPEATPAPVEKPEKLTTGWVKSNYVHIRAGAGTKYAVLGTLNYQDKVEIIQQNARGRWHKIWFEDQTAYVYDKYIYVGAKPTNTPDPAAATPAPEEISPRTVAKTSVSVAEVGTCTTNGVIVRAERTVRSDYYGKLRAGEQVYIQSYGDSWCKIYVPLSNNNGYIGYAHTKYLDIDTPEVTEAQQENPKIIAGFAGMAR